LQGGDFSDFCEMEILRKGHADVDESAAEYLLQLIRAGEASDDDERTLLEQVIEKELGSEEALAMLMELRNAVGARAKETENGEVSGVQNLSKEQKQNLNTLVGLEQEPRSAASEKGDGASLKRASRKEKIEKKGPKRRQAEVNAGRRAAETAAAAKEHEVGEGEFYTKRFEKYHKTWTGHDQWKVQEHRLADTVQELDDDDYSSAWLECLRLGIPWGGRGAGGRGVQRMTGESKDVLVHNVTMARSGKHLLHNATLKLMYGTHYVLAGDNGTGKTTLLRRIATGTLPGFPPYLSVQFVEQELKGTDMKPVEYVVKYDFERTRLLREENEILESLENELKTDEEVFKLQTRLSEVYERLEQISAFDAENRAEAALRNVGLDDKFLKMTTNELSEGWRMRVALCGTLLMKPDVLLLDEPTNHLDAIGVAWLTEYLTNRSIFGGTILLVTHDRAFMNAVADELIVLRKQQLSYFPGSYDEYREMLWQKRQMQAHKLESQAKKKEKIMDYISTQQRAARDKKSKGGDPKKQKQIHSRKKQIEMLDKRGFGREDGRYFRESYDYWGVPSALDFDEKPLGFSLVKCPSDGKSDEILIQLDNISFGWPGAETLIENFTAQCRGNSRIGICGRNGSGKSSLTDILMNDPENFRVELRSGTVTKNLRHDKIALFKQEMVSMLAEEYPNAKNAAELILSLPRGPSTLNCQTVEQAREYLGIFGFTGDLALQPIDTLSGGQKSRLCIAIQSYNRQPLWIMDEVESHLDISSIEKLAEAIQAYNGAVIIISHDQDFLARTCTELWLLDPKTKSIIVKVPPMAEALPDTVKTTTRITEEAKAFVRQTFSEFFARNR